MRAPPDAHTSTYGKPEEAACSMPRARRSPATIESVPPTKPKSNAASQIGLPLSVQVPVRTDSLRPSDSSSSTTSSYRFGTVQVSRSCDLMPDHRSWKLPSSAMIGIHTSAPRRKWWPQSHT